MARGRNLRSTEADPLESQNNQQQNARPTSGLVVPTVLPPGVNANPSLLVAGQAVPLVGGVDAIHSWQQRQDALENTVRHLAETVQTLVQAHARAAQN